MCHSETDVHNLCQPHALGTKSKLPTFSQTSDLGRGDIFWSADIRCKWFWICEQSQNGMIATINVITVKPPLIWLAYKDLCSRN